MKALPAPAPSFLPHFPNPLAPHIPPHQRILPFHHPHPLPHHPIYPPHHIELQHPPLTTPPPKILPTPTAQTRQPSLPASVRSMQNHVDIVGSKDLEDTCVSSALRVLTSKYRHGSGIPSPFRSLLSYRASLEATVDSRVDAQSCSSRRNSRHVISMELPSGEYLAYRLPQPPPRNLPAW